MTVEESIIKAKALAEKYELHQFGTSGMPYLDPTAIAIIALLLEKETKHE